MTSTQPRTVALLSGGMDSTTLIGHLRHAGHHVLAVSVDYGQRHARELDAATQVAEHYGLPHLTVDLTGLGKLLTGSALTDPAVTVPEGHYADESMRATVVPNRNAIMLMAAVGVAAARGYQQVATAVHAGDHPIYPDCRPEFIRNANWTAQAATAGYGDVSIVAPFVDHDKTWIATRAVELGVPLHLTWSCYQGGTMHCGRCGTCVERRESLNLAGVADPTEYEATDV